MQLRYLESVELDKSTKLKQTNGSYINSYEKISNHKVILEEITDEASISIYGAVVNKMYRVSSPLGNLEEYLKTKVNDDDDNISKYFIKYNLAYYKIVAVRKHWIDIEYKESVSSPISI